MEIQRLRLPRRILSPHVCTRFENVGLRELRIATASKVLLEKWEENIAAVVVAGIGGKLHTPKMFAVEAGPSTVHPWTHHQGIENPRIVFSMARNVENGPC